MIDQQNMFSDEDKAEQERLHALRQYQLLDTPSEIAFNRITRMAARVFEAPIAIFNLIDADRQWTKASSDETQYPLPRDLSFCAHTIKQRNVLVVPDTQRDPRFVDNPLVTGPNGLRFYAGAPVRTASGAAIGSLCIGDVVPRTLNDQQQAMLADFAALVMDEIELRKQLAEREQAEQQRLKLLMREQAAYKHVADIFESISDAFFAVDNDWCFTFVNAAAERLLQRERAQLFGQNLWQQLPKALYSAFYKHSAQAMQSQQPIVFEDSVPAENIWLEAHIYPNATGLSVYLRDISERKQNEFALELRDRAIAAASNGILITDAQQPDNPIIYCNPAFESITGYRQEEVLGRNCRLLQGPATNPQHIATIRNALATGSECRVTIQNYRKNGTPFWNKLSISPIRDELGHITHFVGVQVDVTGRQRVEQELLNQAELLREQAQLLDLASDAILVHDLQRGRIRFWNQGAEAMYGYTKTEALDAQPYELLQTQFPQPLPEIVAQVLHVGQWQGEIVHHRRDGAELVVASHWTLQCTADGTPTTILEINRDITERRQTERERADRLADEQTARLVAESAQKRSAFLAEAGSAIASSLDLDTIVGTTARLIVHQLADVCIIDLVDQHGVIRRAAIESRVSSTFAPDDFDILRLAPPGLVADVCAGSPAQILITAPSTAASGTTADNDTQLQDVSKLNVSAMIVPLITRGRTIGTISMVSVERRYTDADLTMVEDLAHRAAQAIDNAQLFCDVQAAIQHKDQALALLDTLLATAPIGFAFLNRDLRYQLINHRLAEIGGLSVDEHLGRTVREAIPGIAEVIEPVLQHVIASGEPVIDLDLTTPATAEKPEQHWLGTYYPVRAFDGELLGTGMIVAEITKIRQMEQALSRSEAQLAGIINSAMDAIITVDEGQRVILFNKAAERIFGCQAADVVGQPLDQFLPERHRAAHRRHIPTFGTTGVTSRSMGIPQTLSARRSNGEEFPIEASISQIEVAGQILYTVILRDITERKRLESQLLQSQKMESVGRLAGGVAHDFNNLLMGIMGYASLALRSVDPGTELHEDLSEVCKAADRAATLTYQLLAFARKQIIEPRIVSLNDLLLDIDKLLRRLIGADIELVILPAERLRLVKVDPGQFQQLLVNLAVNARDAMPQGGRLTLETANVVVDEAYASQHVGLAPGRYVTVTVSDTGSGMDETVKQHLFEPFFTTKESGKGTGLGLATCYGIVKQHGGYISADSQLGHGTTFTIYMPLAAQLSSDQPTLSEREDLPHGRETVLLVEDEPAVRSLAVRVLRQQGYLVLEATNGSEALRLVETQPNLAIDLVLTDVVMPQMGGKALVDQIRAMQPSVKILFMSGYPDRSFNQDGTIDFNINFLQKPFLPGVLARKVRDVLES